MDSLIAAAARALAAGDALGALKRRRGGSGLEVMHDLFACSGCSPIDSSGQTGRIAGLSAERPRGC